MTDREFAKRLNAIAAEARVKVVRLLAEAHGTKYRQVKGYGFVIFTSGKFQPGGKWRLASASFLDLMTLVNDSIYCIAGRTNHAEILPNLLASLGYPAMPREDVASVKKPSTWAEVPMSERHK